MLLSSCCFPSVGCSRSKRPLGQPPLFFSVHPPLPTRLAPSVSLTGKSTAPRAGPTVAAWCCKGQESCRCPWRSRRGQGGCPMRSFTESATHPFCTMKTRHCFIQLAFSEARWSVAYGHRDSHQHDCIPQIIRLRPTSLARPPVLACAEHLPSTVQ